MSTEAAVFADRLPEALLMPQAQARYCSIIGKEPRGGREVEGRVASPPPEGKRDATRTDGRDNQPKKTFNASPNGEEW